MAVDVRIDALLPHEMAEKAESIGVRLVALDELFATADYISLHIPENDATRGLISTELLSLMKDGATIVNCARAGIIDEAALRTAKQKKNLHFYPFFSTIHPRYWRVVLSLTLKPLLTLHHHLDT